MQADDHRPERTLDAKYHWGPRQLPSNMEAEQALLGALMVANRAYDSVSAFLREEHFFYPVHGRIYSAIATLLDRNEPANPIVLKNIFEHDGALAEIGGAQYLGQLVASMITIVNSETYGRTIYDLFLRRELIARLSEVVDQAYLPTLEEPAGALIEKIDQGIMELTEQTPGERGFRPIGEAAMDGLRRTEAAYKAGGEITGLPTGLADVDRVLNGLTGGDVILIGARPSMGKTALMGGIANHIAKHAGVPVGIFELEQSDVQMAQRAMAERSDVSTSRQRRGDVDMIHFQSLVRAADDLKNTQIWIDDSPGLSLLQIRQRSRRLVRRVKCGLIMIDHLQLIGSVGRSENRTQEIAGITKGLKSLAKELNLPVVVLSQLSRGVEQREDKRPMLADLREGGTLEQDADVIMFLYRDEYYLTRREPQRRGEEPDEKFNDRYEHWKGLCDRAHGVAEIIIAKQREGATETVRVHWDAEAMRFSNLIRADRGY